jgi:hypothetical protein
MAHIISNEKLGGLHYWMSENRPDLARKLEDLIFDYNGVAESPVSVGEAYLPAISLKVKKIMEDAGEKMVDYNPLSWTEAKLLESQKKFAQDEIAGKPPKYIDDPELWKQAVKKLTDDGKKKTTYGAVAAYYKRKKEYVEKNQPPAEKKANESIGVNSVFVATTGVEAEIGRQKVVLEEGHAVRVKKINSGKSVEALINGTDITAAFRYQDFVGKDTKFARSAVNESQKLEDYEVNALVDAIGRYSKYHMQKKTSIDNGQEGTVIQIDGGTKEEVEQMAAYLDKSFDRFKFKAESVDGKDVITMKADAEKEKTATVEDYFANFGYEVAMKGFIEDNSVKMEDVEEAVKRIKGGAKLISMEPQLTVTYKDGKYEVIDDGEVVDVQNDKKLKALLIIFAAKTATVCEYLIDAITEEKQEDEVFPAAEILSKKADGDTYFLPAGKEYAGFVSDGRFYAKFYPLEDGSVRYEIYNGEDVMVYSSTCYQGTQLKAIFEDSSQSRGNAVFKAILPDIYADLEYSYDEGTNQLTLTDPKNVFTFKDWKNIFEVIKRQKDLVKHGYANIDSVTNGNIVVNLYEDAAQTVSKDNIAKLLSDNWVAQEKPGIFPLEDDDITDQMSTYFNSKLAEFRKRYPEFDIWDDDYYGKSSDEFVELLIKTAHKGGYTLVDGVTVEGEQIVPNK